MSKKAKICLAASAGGHLSQLLKLKDSYSGKETFFITTTDVVKVKLGNFGRVYCVGQCDHQHPLLTLKVLVRCCRIIFAERPDFVISTGAAPGCIACVLGKIIGAHIVWVDSITNVKKISLSGRIIRHITDLFLVQWPQLARRHKNIEYRGALL